MSDAEVTMDHLADAWEQGLDDEAHWVILGERVYTQYHDTYLTNAYINGQEDFHQKRVNPYV